MFVPKGTSITSSVNMATQAEVNARSAQNVLELTAKVKELFGYVQGGEITSFQKAAKRFPLGSDGATLRSLRDEYGRSMLHHAAQMGRHKMCEHLIDEHKFEVNDQDSAGVHWGSGVHAACSNRAAMHHLKHACRVACAALCNNGPDL